MSYTFAEYVTSLANELVVDPTMPEFLVILPRIIEYAEERIYRELDILNTVVRQTGTLTSGSRNFTLPTTSGRFVVTNGFNLITPSSTTNPDLGTRNQMLPASRDYLDSVGGDVTYTGQPKQYAPITDQLFVVGPEWPDANYTVEVVGTIRPTPLSASNTTTYLTNYLPDLFFAASMIAGAGWQKNFGAQSDDPQAAQSWESQYGKLLASANAEEQRKRYASLAWGSLSATPMATPNR